MLKSSMNFFDIILVQPIFNILVLIYGLIPGQDFGVALILFTIIVRMLLWPLVKKQLRQTKVMRELQPELAKIKARAKGNRQLESQLMMELYKERGVNPFSSIGTLLLQLPVFIALFAVVRLITENHANIAKFTYDFLEGIPGIHDAIAGQLHHTLFGIVDLTKHATDPGGAIYWPLMVMAVIAGILQYFQAKMLLPQPKEKRKLREVLKDQAAGKQVDQAEMSALMSGKMIWLFPFLTFFVASYLEGALVLYLMTTNAVAIVQQYFVLHKDESDLERLSEKTKTRARKAVEAEVVAAKKTSTAAKKGASKKKRR
jgi:YidC/Oxa1 family membrane protein insertase